MDLNRSKKENAYKKAIQKEIDLVEKQEARLAKAVRKQTAPQWKHALESKIPAGVYENLKKAFRKAFAIVFEKGTGIIEKSYQRENIEAEHEIWDYAFQVKADRKVLKKMRKQTASANLRNMAMTTVEGVGLGALGIGLPDIVIFVGVMLKGIYEAALSYGFEYDTPGEQFLILKMMETSMLRGAEWEKENGGIDLLLADSEIPEPSEAELKEQMERTANVFAMDMLLLKFIQGLPVAGILGGTGNPVYYNKVLKYVQIKYRKRYLYKLGREPYGQ